MKACPAREEALALLKKYNSEPFHIQHALTVEGVMRWYANELGYGEDADFWATVGLLHDVDFEKWPEQHCVKAPELLQEIGCSEDLIHAVCSAGVHLCMGQTRTAEQLKDAGFEAVINAVGAHSAAPRIPGIDSVNVADAWKVLAGEQQVYGTVAVIGGGMVGCETAEYLAARGCKVSVIEMMDKIAAGESTTILPTLLENYKTYGVEQYPSHKVKEFRMDAVVCENKDGAEVTIPCDYIVLAMGARSNAFDAAALESAGIPVYSIGDAAGKAADISNAIRTGYDTACQL